MHKLKLYLFGFPRVERGGQPVLINRRKMLALLSYLLVTGQPHSREALAALLWPEFDSSSALANLRRDLSRLKEILGKEVLLIEREKVQIRPGAEVWVDVVAFEACIHQAEEHGDLRALSGPALACDTCRAHLEEAVSLYTDGFLAGFNLPDSPSFDDWQFFQGERLRGLFADALVYLARFWTEQGAYEKAIEPARRWLALDPLHEPAYRMLMQAYAWTGQPSAALRQYKVLVDLMERELGAAPEAETTALYDAIRSRKLTPPVRENAKPTVEKTPQPAAVQESPAARFQVDSLLTTGGFGEIFHGVDHQTGKSVAIKRLLPQLVASRPEVIERFVREGQALEQLSHPNIVPMLAFYEHEGTYNLVMEYLPGGTLRDQLDQEGALPVQRALEIALELADALSRAHHLHILHRDLKPENILLDTDGHPRLIDFGLALLQGSDSRLTQAGVLLGSPAYMSPEAIQGQEMDHRSDIWAFGVLLFEMLTGGTPFKGEQFHTLLHQILNEGAPPLRQLRPEAPPALEQLIARMLEKDREQRLPSIRLAAAEMEAIRDGKAGASHSTISSAANLPDGSTPSSSSYMVNLPAQPSQLFGRQSELTSLYELIDNPDVRLVTLVGTGGIGKTRLAVEAASQMAKEMSNGAVFVALAPVSSAEFLLPAIANALHFRFSPGAALKEQLANRLKGQKMLLVLDNFEHLLDGAGLISEILADAPGIQVLVTSRERLNLVEEWVFEVGGLPFPPPDEPITGETELWIKKYSAVQLFIDRARRSNPGLVVDELTLAEVVHICQLVEGMPLALELAAPWVRAMSCAEIAQEIMQGIDILSASMRNLPDRHRSVRVIFDQSWETLSPVEQATLARLSVFHNGCTREATERVAGAKLYVLMALVDKALLRHRANRYDMHELVRQYAAEKLGQNPANKEETLNKHYRHYMEWLAYALAGYKGGRQLQTGLEVTADIDNIRAAWNRAAEQNDHEALFQAAEPFWLYNEFRGTLAQGAAAFRRAIESIRSPEDDPGLVGFLCAAEGSLLARQWYLEQGSVLMEQGVALLRKADPFDAGKTAFVLAWYAFLQVMHGQYSEAARTAQESLGYYDRTGDRWTQAGALRLLGAVALYQGQLLRAQEYLDQCVQVCKSIGELRIRTYATSNLGVVHLWHGQVEEARQYFEESVRISKACNDRLSRADALCAYVRFYIETGAYEKAVEQAQKCIRTYKELGRNKISLANILLANALHLMGKEGAEEALQEGLVSAQLVNQRADIAVGLEVMGKMAFDRKAYAQAYQYFKEGLQIWEELGNDLSRAALLCRTAFSLIVSGSENTAEIHEMLTQALSVGRSQRAGTVAIAAMVGLAALQRNAGESKLADDVIRYARTHPATPHEVRNWIEQFGSDLPPAPHSPGESAQEIHWTEMVECWEHQQEPC